MKLSLSTRAAIAVGAGSAEWMEAWLEAWLEAVMGGRGGGEDGLGLGWMQDLVLT